MSDAGMELRLLDSHAHVISSDSGRYPSAPPGGALPPGVMDNPVTADRLLDLMDEGGVARAILVQRGSVYGFDNRYVCDSARLHPDRFRAVCAIDAAATDSADEVRRWIDEGAIGIRFMQLQRTADIEWLHGVSADAAWEEAARLQIPVCVHLFPWNRVAGMEALARIITRLPHVNLIIDHLSNIDPLVGAPDYGVDALLARFAHEPSVYLKFTTIPLGAMARAEQAAAPVLQRLIAAGFTPQRIMWGTDIGQSAGSYGFQTGLGKDAVATFTVEDQQSLLGGSAAAAYQWL